MAKTTDPKPKKPKKDFLGGYKTYDPAVEGYGSSDQWSENFRQRLGFEEAEAILHGRNETPRSILGVGAKATWEDIKKAFRTKAMAFHPDMVAHSGLSVEEATEKIKQINAAFTVLEREFGK